MLQVSIRVTATCYIIGASPTDKPHINSKYDFGICRDRQTISFVFTNFLNTFVFHKKTSKTFDCITDHLTHFDQLVDYKPPHQLHLLSFSFTFLYYTSLPSTCENNHRNIDSINLMAQCFVLMRDECFVKVGSGSLSPFIYLAPSLLTFSCH